MCLFVQLSDMQFVRKTLFRLSCNMSFGQYALSTNIYDFAYLILICLVGKELSGVLFSANL